MVPANRLNETIDSGEAGHVASYYAASANPIPDCPELTGTVDCDVCVIGAGITGSSAALELAERGFSTVLLEAQWIGWGASGRSGGQAIFGFGCDQSKLERIVGPDLARRLWDKETGDSLDKDVFRFDKGDLASAYREVARRIVPEIFE